MQSGYVGLLMWEAEHIVHVTLQQKLINDPLKVTFMSVLTKPKNKPNRDSRFHRKVLLDVMICYNILEFFASSTTLDDSEVTCSVT